MSQVSFPEPLWVAAEQQAPARQPLPTWGFLEWFVIGQTALPALVYLQIFHPLRFYLRTGAFLVSLAALLWVQFHKKVEGSRHPSGPWLICAIAYLALMIFHPTTNTLLAGVGQTMLYLSVLAPVFWAPSVVRGPAHLQRIMWLLLILNGINAGVGVLQVYDPMTWMPKEMTTAENVGVVQIAAKIQYLSYKGPEGENIVRPTGLFDSPGAVAGPGMFAGLIGLVFCVTSKGMGKRIVALLFAFLGVAVIYLTQVRTSLIVLLGMVLVYTWMLLLHRQISKALSLVGLTAALATAAFALALLMGGGSIRDRFATLVADNPSTIYYKNRGQQLEHGFTDYLVDHPFGAGLGRWGMMRTYFGNPYNLDSPPLWAEIQFPAWILDGGFVLLILYSAGLIASIREGAQQAIRGKSENLRSVAAFVFAVNAGTIALMLSFPPFSTQIGLQYWLLSGALHGAAQSSAEEKGPELPPGFANA